MRNVTARQLRRLLWRWQTCRALVGTLGLTVLGATGCSLDGLLKSDELPPTVTDPAITETPEGALAAYYGTVAQFRTAFGGTGSGAASVIATAGLLSDELRSITSYVVWEDVRSLPGDEYPSAETYARLQKVRGQGGQAIGLLTRYRPDEPALAGYVYALQGYAEVFLAELFCSGVPLSTLDYGGDYTYQPGSSTEQVFAHARALFDTALVLGSDSAAVVHLARVGQARALLAVGQYDAAAQTAAVVPDGYEYALRYPATQDTSGNVPSFANLVQGPSWAYSVADREGSTGLDYITSGDPRTSVSELGTTPEFGTQWYPRKYNNDGSTPLVVASGIEARLIEAEAALRAADPSWRTTLNALRTDGSFEITGTSPPDTLWHAGTGGVAGLRPLADPGTDSARVSLVFRERAFWLFLTGHRQGDLRRLLRQYAQYWPTQDRVYPVGQYGGFAGQYGGDVTVPVPHTERLLNPRFTGCLSRGP